MDRPIRILVVDNEVQNLELVEAILKHIGYHCLLACDGTEAMAKLNSSIDLVLIDAMIPGIDGYEVTRRIRHAPEFCDLPIIMMTNHMGEADRLSAAEAGSTDFISKPIDSIELRVRMASLLKMKEAQDAVKRHRTELEVMVDQRTKALRESEERYRTLFQNSLDAIFIFTMEGKIVDGNQAFTELTGYTRSEIFGMDTRVLYVDPADRALFLRNIRTRGFVRDHEWKVRRKDGKERDCIFTASVRHGADGAAIGYQGIIRDITRNKKAEEALRQSEERMRLLIEASPIGILIVQQGRCSYVNPALVKMFKYEVEHQIVGLSFAALCVPEERGSLENKAQGLLSGTDTDYLYDMRALRGNGEPFDVSVWFSAIDFWGQTSLLGFVVDVSEQRELKARLLQAEKMEAIGTLAGGIAHDFNNILYVIMGYSELALDEMTKGTRGYTNLKQVLKAADRAKEMVNQILTFSHQGEQERMPIKLIPIVKETLKFLRASIPTTIEIRQSIQPGVGAVLSNPTQIHQVLMNLCTNAAHAMRERGGILHVSLTQREMFADFASKYPDITLGTYLILSVCDTGHGMPPEVQERIFDPYFTTKRHGEGTGLGLAVVHGIVKSHGGIITVESRPGIGSTFQAYFPVIEEQTTPEELSGEFLPTGHERILLVDDERAVVEIAKQMLQRLGYKVAARTSSVEALELFLAKPSEFDLILTDMTMPNMTGTELARKIKCVREDIPIILCTGFSELITEELARSMGISALVMKPILRSKLAETIRMVVDGPADRN